MDGAEKKWMWEVGVDIELREEVKGEEDQSMGRGKKKAPSFLHNNSFFGVPIHPTSPGVFLTFDFDFFLPTPL